MENCTIYSHKLAFEKVVHIVKSYLPKAKIEYTDDGPQKSLVATTKVGFFGKTKTLKINYRERKNPSYKLDQIECDLTRNLTGMVNFIQSLPTQNEDVKNKLLLRVMSANCEIPFLAEPIITSEFESVLRNILQELDAIVFSSPNRIFNTSSGQHFTDKHLQLVIDTNGQCAVRDLDVNIDAKYHNETIRNYTEEQLSRKAASEKFLDAYAIKTNPNLPCIPSSSEVALRAEIDIVDRAYALLVTAVKGEGGDQEHLEKTVTAKKIDSLSPREKHIYQTETLDDQETSYSIWRYESLYTVLWALGIIDDLIYPNQICEVQAIVEKILHPSRTDVERSVKLRSKTEILDELDKTYRMNWACVDAQVKGEEVSGSIVPSVVYERHYTLNWLTGHQNQDWDDVSTNT